MGDFYQLPPVLEKGSELDQHGIVRSKAHLALGINLFGNRGLLFQAACFPLCNFETIVLKQIYRQQDREFLDMLEEIKRGKLSAEVKARLLSTGSQLDPETTLQLTPKRDESDAINLRRMNALPDSSVTLFALDEVEVEAELKLDPENAGLAIEAEAFLRENKPFYYESQHRAQIELKVGARVMNIRNAYKGEELVLYNGQQGTVVGWMTAQIALTDLEQQLKQLELRGQRSQQPSNPIINLAPNASTVSANSNVSAACLQASPPPFTWKDDQEQIINEIGAITKNM